MLPHAFTVTLTRRTMGEAAYTIAEVPADVSAALLATESGTRVLASYNGGAVDQTRLLPAGAGGAGGYYLLVSVEKQGALGLALGDTVDVQLVPDESDYGMPVPEEWADRLADDGALAREFAALTPGRQRRILYVVGKPKGAATRSRKAAGAAEYLREVGAGGFDYAGLLEALKAR